MVQVAAISYYFLYMRIKMFHSNMLYFKIHKKDIIEAFMAKRCVSSL